MKFVYCQCCGDLRKLKLREVMLCNCKAVGGFYLDDLHAVISQEAIPIGWDNRSFAAALKGRPIKGDGHVYTAFTIPEECPTVVRLDRTGEPCLLDVHSTNRAVLVDLLLGSLSLTYELHRATKDYTRQVGNHPKHTGADAGKNN